MQQKLAAATLDPVPARRVDDVPVAEEMSDSFLAYALSVITARAIPDVRDGLKPVQRRVLWSMLQMGLRPGTPFRKSARIVGDTMGRYHPHGDAAIYDTLVRMGQDFGRMVTLVDPQGNFGSLDDPPAAARYTECRLSSAAMDLVDELEEDTVDFRPTYDGEGLEPVVLPAALPNLLVNGTVGIAVGMATNMASHNLAEVAAAIELVMQHQSPGDADADTDVDRQADGPTVDDLLAVLPGPDFPGGGVVVADDGVRRAYETGRGAIRVRARAWVEPVTKRRDAIIVTELPQLVGPERVVSRITDLAAGGRLAGVSGVADLSDMDGMRLQVDLKPGVDAAAVLRELHRLTPLEDTVNVNNVVLVDGVPTTLGLRALCEHYVKHRLEVISRRTRYRLHKAEERLHIVEGLLVALDNIDEVVAIIRSSADSAEARHALSARFDLSEAQATSILDMALRRLSALEGRKLREEADGLRSDMAEYRGILASERRRRSIVRSELRRIVNDHGTPRRSELMPAEVADREAELADSAGPRSSRGTADRVGARSPARGAPCAITLSTSGRIGRAPLKGARRGVLGSHDLIAARASVPGDASVSAVSNAGRVFPLSIAELAPSSGRGRGDKASGLFDLNRGERVIGLVAPGDDRLVLVTSRGRVKRLGADTVLGADPGAPMLGLEPRERVVAAFSTRERSDLVIVADDARAIRFAASSVSPRNAAGPAIAGMSLSEGADAAFAGAVIADAADVVIATRGGAVKATDCFELPAQGRNGKGVLVAKLAAGDAVVTGVVAPAAGLLALMAADNDPRRTDPRPVPLALEATPRYRAPQAADRPVRAIAPGRWTP